MDKGVKFEADTSIKKIVTVQSDGKQLFIRLPKELTDYLQLEKKDQLEIKLNPENKDEHFEVRKTE